MTAPLLATFRSGQGNRNVRGELDGAAWRFAFPQFDAVTWVDPAPGDRRDIAALARCVPVRECAAGDVEAPSPSGLVVGRGPAVAAIDAPLALDLQGRELPVPLDLVYENDELRGVVIADDPAAQALLERHVGPPGEVPRSLRQRVKRRPAITRRVEQGSATDALVAAGRVPTWVSALAEAAPAEVAGSRWFLWCRGDYGSQKLVLFLVPPGAHEPDVVLKITRDARFNDRLRNEAAVLHSLAALGPVSSGRAPAPVFEGEHLGSFVSAQTAVVGSALPAILEQGDDGPVRDVASWLAELAAATAAPAADEETATALGEMLGWYEEAYAPDPEVRRFLRSQVDVLVDAGVPAVLEHGDPGPWNAVQQPDGRVAFLDWEAGETRGLPLWDLLYFLRSATLKLGGRAPWQSRLAATRRHLVLGSALTPLVADAVATHVDRLDLAPATVEPLVHLCWVHRAVKEAARLPESRRARGQFHRLLLAGIEHRSAHGFRAITGGRRQ